MEKNQCFELGYIERTQGLEGSVIAVFDVDDSSRYRKIDALFIEQQNQLVPFLVNRISPSNGNRFILQLEGVSNESAAQNLKGSTLFLPETALPKLKENQFFFHELIGAQVLDKNLGLLGTVQEIYEFPNQTLLGMVWNGTEILIPAHSDILISFERQTKQVITNLPGGLLDVYLQPSELQINEN